MNQSSSLNMRCAACDGHESIRFFSTELPVDVGYAPPSAEQARRAPFGTVDLCFCTSCGLVFNRSFEQHRPRFEPGYAISLTHSSVFRSFSESVAKRLIQRHGLSGKTVVEIGCGKGEFLSLICRWGGNRGYGFDPALPASVTHPAGDGQVHLTRGFYGREHAPVDVDFLCCLSVFETLARPAELLQQVREAFADRQAAVYFQTRNGFRTLKKQSAWSILFEECTYWSEESLRAIFERQGFGVLDAGPCYSNGEYLYVEAQTAARRPVAEPARRLELPGELAGLAAHHQRTLGRWTEALARLDRQGRRVVVWGTGGKGIHFLNSFPPHYFAGVVDINPDRQGRFIPGSAQRIEDPGALTRIDPDLIVITNPIYETEIRQQVAQIGIRCDFRVA